MSPAADDISLITESHLNRDNLDDLLGKIAQREGAGQCSPHEMRAYARALTLARAGAISHARIIARPRASG